MTRLALIHNLGPNERSVGTRGANCLTDAKAELVQSTAGTTRQRLVDAAIGLFAERGFATASIREVAREANMSLAGVYHHFNSKDELLFEIQRESFERLMAPLNVLPSSAPARQRLEMFVDNHLSFFSERMTEMKVLSHELEALSGPMGAKIGTYRFRYYRFCLDAVTDLIKERGRKAVDPYVATMSLFGMLNWIYRWYGARREHTPHELGRQMLTIFLQGIEDHQDNGIG